MDMMEFLQVLKASMPYIISPLTYICNDSLAQVIFPDRLKFAAVKPIFRNGDKHEPSNYRPISLLSTFSKVRFDVFTAVTMKNGVCWVVTPCGSCKNRRFGLGISSQHTSVASCSLCCS
jgi:hypothetical protein